MVFRIFTFIFYIEPMVRNDIWIRATSVTVMVIFRRCHAKSYLITVMFKVRSQQLQATLTAVLWKTPGSWRFYKHESTYVQIFLGQLSRNEYWRRCLQNYHLHKNPSVHFKEHFNNTEDDISLIFIRFFFCPRNLIFEFNLVLTE